MIRCCHVMRMARNRDAVRMTTTRCGCVRCATEWRRFQAQSHALGVQCRVSEFNRYCHVVCAIHLAVIHVTANTTSRCRLQIFQTDLLNRIHNLFGRCGDALVNVADGQCCATSTSTDGFVDIQNPKLITDVQIVHQSAVGFYLRFVVQFDFVTRLQ